eukprot:COSAG01_NODE_2182_length_8212_cov_7.046838_9_plen_163_part_00
MEMSSVCNGPAVSASSDGLLRFPYSSVDFIFGSYHAMCSSASSEGLHVRGALDVEDTGAPDRTAPPRWQPPDAETATHARTRAHTHARTNTHNERHVCMILFCLGYAIEECSCAPYASVCCGCAPHACLHHCVPPLCLLLCQGCTFIMIRTEAVTEIPLPFC